MPAPTVTQIGVIEDTENRDRLAKLLRFSSSQSDEASVSLEQYVARMKEGQKDIYYMAADNVQVRGAARLLRCVHCICGPALMLLSSLLLSCFPTHTHRLPAARHSLRSLWPRASRCCS